jgi:hypothetical protein
LKLNVYSGWRCDSMAAHRILPSAVPMAGVRHVATKSQSDRYRKNDALISCATEANADTYRAS